MLSEPASTMTKRLHMTADDVHSLVLSDEEDDLDELDDLYDPDELMMEGSDEFSDLEDENDDCYDPSLPSPSPSTPSTPLTPSTRLPASWSDQLKSHHQSLPLHLSCWANS